MKGTEKQIKWAEEIKAAYLEKMAEAAEYYKKIVESGHVEDEGDASTALVFVEVYHPDATYTAVKSDMKTSDLYKALRSAESGTPEKKAAGKAFRSAVAAETIKRLEEAVEKRAANDDAAFWIESRMR